MDITIPLRFSDFDRFGHVNHARVISLCEDHRIAMFRELDRVTGEEWADNGFVVARIEADYRRPILPETEAVIVSHTVEAVGRSSVRVRYQVFADSEVAADVVAVMVRIDNQVPSPLSPAARAWFDSGSTPADPDAPIDQ